MSQVNQHTSDKAVAPKAKTTDALRAEIVPPATQEPVQASGRLDVYLREEQFKTKNRIAEVDVIIRSFQAEKDDLSKTLDAIEAGMTILAEKNRPQFTAIDGGQQ